MVLLVGAPKHGESYAIDIVVQCSNKANPGTDTLFEEDNEVSCQTVGVLKNDQNLEKKSQCLEIIFNFLKNNHR